MARFEREAQLLASLNHPNIAAIPGLEDSTGVRALVMELVEGPTLAHRIAQGAIPSLKPSRLRSRSPKGSKRRTSEASFIAKEVTLPITVILNLRPSP
jgi:serine/threonine protein kinase